jgi:cytolysin-activating lysine-acyltransferase
MRDNSPSNTSTVDESAKNGLDHQSSTVDERVAVDKGDGKARDNRQKRAIDLLQTTKAFFDMVGVMMRSAPQRHLFLADLEWFLLPALSLGQYKIYGDGKQVQSFADWATLSEAVEKRLIADGTKLRPSDWRSGERLWLIELVGPNINSKQVFGQLIGDLVKGPFAGKKFKMMGTDPKTGKRRMLEFGSKASKSAIDKPSEAKLSEAKQ